MILTARHPDITQQEKSFLSVKSSAISSSITAKSAKGFTTNQLIIIGPIGSERTEIKKIASVNAATKVITLATTGGWTPTVFDHPVESPITVIPYDQVEFYVCHTLGGGETLMSTKSIDVDQEYSTYEYVTGVDTDYFQVRYKNSITSPQGVSNFSGWIPATGYKSTQLTSLIDDIRVFEGENPADEDITKLINLAQEAVFAFKDNWYFAIKKLVQTTVDSTARFDLPVDFRTFGEAYLYDSVSLAYTKLKFVDFDNYMMNYASNSTESDTQSIITVDYATKEFVVSPIPKNGGNTITITYYCLPTNLVHYVDETIIPDPRVLVFWVVSKIEGQKKNPEQCKLYWNEYSAAMNTLSNKRKTELFSFMVK